MIIQRKVLATALLAAGVGSVFTYMLDKGHSSAPVIYAQEARSPGLTFAPVVRKALPAVVSVASTRVIETQSRGRSGPGRGGRNPLEDLFGDFFGGGRGMPMPEERAPRRAAGLGSGVIVTGDGYILTNNHVVEEASEIKVTLNDRREFDGKVIGTDPQTDVAVVKITATGLPTLPLSQGAVQVGDVALAIGNPFGIGQTVTMGIIGATGRSGLNPTNYEDFIQTDAAINPGNSGGALVNTDGQLVGINTAIISRTGGNQGIGFAIPVAMAREVMDQLIKTGKVVRGFIGVGIQEVTPELQKALGLQSANGVLITSVELGSPGEKAGIHVNDLVTGVNGDTVSDINQFRLRVSRTAPGTSVRLRVNREGREQEIPVTLAALPSRDAQESSSRDGAPGQRDALQGVTVEALTPEIARELRLPSAASGVIVSEVDPDSSAAEAGLRRGDIVESVNRHNVANVREFDTQVRAGAGKPIALLVRRGPGSAYVVVEPR